MVVGGIGPRVREGDDSGCVFREREKKNDDRERESLTACFSEREKRKKKAENASKREWIHVKIFEVFSAFPPS